MKIGDNSNNLSVYSGYFERNGRDGTSLDGDVVLSGSSQGIMFRDCSWLSNSRSAKFRIRRSDSVGVTVVGGEAVLPANNVLMQITGDSGHHVKISEVFLNSAPERPHSRAAYHTNGPVPIFEPYEGSVGVLVD